jgi:hypothetical protein
MYCDRFIRPVNPDVFHARPLIESEVPTGPRLAYRRTLSEALLGRSDLGSSIFSKQVVRRPSPFACNPSRIHAAAEPKVTFTPSSCRRRLDGPGMVSTEAVSTKPLAIRDEGGFIAALGNDVYAYDVSRGTAPKVCSIARMEGEEFLPSERTISHITVVDPNAGTFVVADTTGQTYPMRVGGYSLEQPQGSGDPVVGLETLDRSTVVIGTEGGRLRIGDLRAKNQQYTQLPFRISALSHRMDSPLVAVGSDHLVAIFDTRKRDKHLVARKGCSSPVTALAWDVNTQSQTLFAAFGGQSPTLTVNDVGASILQRSEKKTHGIVRSILPTHSEAVVTLRDNTQGKCAVMWKYSPEEPSEMPCTQIGAVVDMGGESVYTSPSAGVMGKGEDFFVVAFPKNEAIVLWPLATKPSERPVLDRSGIHPFYLR